MCINDWLRHDARLSLLVIRPANDKGACFGGSLSAVNEGLLHQICVEAHHARHPRAHGRGRASRSGCLHLRRGDGARGGASARLHARDTIPKVEGKQSGFPFCRIGIATGAGEPPGASGDAANMEAPSGDRLTNRYNR